MHVDCLVQLEHVSWCFVHLSAYGPTGVSCASLCLWTSFHWTYTLCLTCLLAWAALCAYEGQPLAYT